MILPREGARIAHRTTIFRSFYAQALVGTLFTVVLPTIIALFQISYNTHASGPLYNSIVVGAVAFWLGLIVLHRVTAFPGTNYFGYILPSFLATFGAMLTSMFLLRVEYSRFYIGSSFIIAVVFSYLMGVFVDRYMTLKFWVVPAGRIANLIETENVEWLMMTEPEVPPRRPVAIVADLRFDHAPAWERMLAEAAVNGRPVYHTKQLRESLTGQVSMEHLSENSFGSLLPNLAYVKVKRVSDIVFAMLLIPIFSIPMIMIGIAIRLDSAGPVFFRQERIGYRGQKFRMYKFRTMRARETVNEGDAARYDAMTRSDDDRITRVGRVLRKSRLDELPQLLNVLRGDMSLIGPRPEAVALSHWYESELAFYFYRHIVRPGMTGWAQVRQGHVTDLMAVDRKLSYDFYYIKNFSVWLDILIILRTIPTMLSGFGSK